MTVLEHIWLINSDFQGALQQKKIQSPSCKSKSVE